MNGILLFLLIIVVVTPGQWYHYQLTCHGFSVASLSSFHGARLQLSNDDLRTRRPSSTSAASGEITMRKQKASDRRTRRMQRGGEELTQEMIRENLSRREVASLKNCGA